MSEIVKAAHPFKAMQQISRNLENMITFKKAEQRADQEAFVERKQQMRLQAATAVAAPAAFGGLTVAAGALTAFLSLGITEIFDNIHKEVFNMLGIKSGSTVGENISNTTFEKIPSSPTDDMSDLPPAEKIEKSSDIEYDTIDKKLDEVDKSQIGFFNTIRKFFGFDIPKPETESRRPVTPKPVTPTPVTPTPQQVSPTGTPMRQSPRQERQTAAKEQREAVGTPIPHRTPTAPAGVSTGGTSTPPIDTSNLPKYTPGASGGSATGNMDLLNTAMDEMGFTGESQRAGLAAITLGESGFRAVAENMNYSAARAREIFGFEPVGGWEKVCAAGPVAVAEAVYGYQSRNAAARHLGNDKPGDGWNYRGRGFIQHTGKANYAAISKAVNVDLVSNPDALLDPKIAAKAAVYYMRQAGSPSDFTRQLIAVGGSREGWPRKRQYYEKFMREGTFKAGSGRGAPQPTATASTAPPPEEDKSQPKIRVVDGSSDVNRQTASATPPLPTDRTLAARNTANTETVRNQNLATITGTA